MLRKRKKLLQLLWNNLNLGCYMDEIGQNIELGDTVVDKQTVYKCTS